MLGGIVAFTACGLGKDEVTNTNYKVTVEDAANIYQKIRIIQKFCLLTLTLVKALKNMSICLLTRLKKYI